MNKKPNPDISKDTSTSDTEENNKLESSKYLTEMKELPPELEEESKSPPKLERKVVIREENSQLSASEEKPPEKEVKKLSAEPGTKDNSRIEKDEFEDEEKTGLPLSSKDIILGIINLVTIVFLIIILARFPKKALDLKALRNESLIEGPKVTFENTEIGTYKEKANALNGLFLEESGVVDFVSEIEKIRAKGRSIVKVTFTSQKAIQDRTQNFGVPIVIEMKGTWESIGQDLEDIEKLPFLFRSATIEILPLEEDTSVVSFKYGVLLYVIDRLGQTR